MKSALIIIDMQNAFYEGYCKTSMAEASLSINKAILVFKKQNLPIIWVQDINKKEGAIPGTEGFNIIDDLNTEEIKHTLHKQHLDCFTETNCANLLTEQDISKVIISGFCADYCVLSSYQGAIKKGFKAVILEEGIAAGSQKDIDNVVKNNETISILKLKQIVLKS